MNAIIEKDTAEKITEVVLKTSGKLVKGIVEKLLEKIGAGDAVKYLTEEALDLAEDSSKEKAAGLLKKIYGEQTIVEKLQTIYIDEFGKLVKNRDDLDKLSDLIEFAAKKADVPVVSEQILIQCIPDWLKDWNKRYYQSPDFNEHDIEAIFKKLYDNVERAVHRDPELTKFWYLLQSVQRIDEVYTIEKNMDKKIDSILQSFEEWREEAYYIQDQTKTYYSNFFQPLCLHKVGDNLVSLSDLFVMPQILEDEKAVKLDTYVQEYIASSELSVLLLMAHGGYGKTSFVSYMAARQPYFCGDRPLHIIRLRKYSRVETDKLCDAIAEDTKRNKIATNAVLVFDGLDELCMMKNEHGEKAAKIMEMLVDVFFRFGGNTSRKIIITSRPGFIDKKWLEENVKTGYKKQLRQISLHTVDYISPNAEMRAEFLEKMECADVRVTEDDKKIGCDFIRNMNDKDAEYCSPFLLYLISCIQLEDIDIDGEKLGNRWYLFRKIFHDLYMSSDYNEEQDTPTNFREDIQEPIYQLTCEFAYEMYQRGLGEHDVIHLSELEGRADGLTKPQMEQLKNSYALSCYFNQTDAGVLEFSHNYIRDFFICEYILGSVDRIIEKHGSMNEEAGSEIADWCSSHLQFGELLENAIVENLIDAYYESNCDTYPHLLSVDGETIHFVFDHLVETGAITTDTMLAVDKVGRKFSALDMFKCVVGNTQQVFFGLLLGKCEHIKWFESHKKVDDFLKHMNLKKADLSNLSLYYVSGLEYYPTTLFPTDFDPQAYGMELLLNESELNFLADVPPFIRRQIKLCIESKIKLCIESNRLNERWHSIFTILDFKRVQRDGRYYGYDPISNTMTDKPEKPRDEDSVIYVNTVTVGEFIRFGNYRWEITGVNLAERKMLVCLRCDIIRRKIFYEEYIIWINSKIRQYLNSDGEGNFLNEFSNLEIERMVQTDLTSRWNRTTYNSTTDAWYSDLMELYNSWNRTTYNNTTERVFLLNWDGERIKHDSYVDKFHPRYIGIWLKF